MIRRRPILRTAAIGGVAYAAGSHTAARSAEQAQMEAAQNAQITDLQQQQAALQQPVAPSPATAYQQPTEPPPVAPPPTAAPEPSSSATPGTLEQLRLLGELHASNVLTDEEFETAKRKILNQL